MLLAILPLAKIANHFNKDNFRPLCKFFFYFFNKKKKKKGSFHMRSSQMGWSHVVNCKEKLSSLYKSGFNTICLPQPAVTQPKRPTRTQQGSSTRNRARRYPETGPYPIQYPLPNPTEVTQAHLSVRTSPKLCRSHCRN
jgi:hypothetical protein